MGQHKYNPTAIAAKNGDLPPKEPKIGKRSLQRAIRKAIVQKLAEGLSTEEVTKLLDEGKIL